MRTKLVVGAVVMIAVLPVAAWGGSRALRREGRAGPQIRAAEAFLASLDAGLKAKASAPLGDAKRKDWKYVPAERAGVSFGEMSEAQRRAARDLLRAGLSSQGMLKVETIVSLESVLRDLENGNAGRDPAKYVFMVFGTPGAAEGWGWKFEGHHVSVNFTLKGAELAGATPMFLGANPGELRSGLFAGRRALAEEEALGRELAASLTEAQRREAVISAEAPADILSAPGRGLDEFWPAKGVAVSALTAEQHEVAARLAAEFVMNLRGPVAEEELMRVMPELRKARFAWMGPMEPGKGHYWRLTGETFVIEYDNTQNGANHPHLVWRDRARDFGADALAEHVRGER